MTHLPSSRCSSSRRRPPHSTARSSTIHPAAWVRPPWSKRRSSCKRGSAPRTGRATQLPHRVRRPRAALRRRALAPCGAGVRQVRQGPSPRGLELRGLPHLRRRQARRSSAALRRRRLRPHRPRAGEAGRVVRGRLAGAPLAACLPRHDARRSALRPPDAARRAQPDAARHDRQTPRATTARSSAPRPPAGLCCRGTRTSGVPACTVVLLGVRPPVRHAIGIPRARRPASSSRSRHRRQASGIVTRRRASSLCPRGRSGPTMRRGAAQSYLPRRQVGGKLIDSDHHPRQRAPPGHRPRDRQGAQVTRAPLHHAARLHHGGPDDAGEVRGAPRRRTHRAAAQHDRTAAHRRAAHPGRAVRALDWETARLVDVEDDE